MDTHFEKTSVECKSTLEFRSTPEYLSVCIYGANRPLKTVLEQWKQIAEQCHQEGYRKVLIHKKADGLMSFSDNHRFGQELPKLGFVGIKIAFVDRQITRSMMNQFAETVAINHGIGAKVFNDIDEAEAWLLS